MTNYGAIQIQTTIRAGGGAHLFTLYSDRLDSPWLRDLWKYLLELRPRELRGTDEHGQPVEEMTIIGEEKQRFVAILDRAPADIRSARKPLQRTIERGHLSSLPITVLYFHRDRSYETIRDRGVSPEDMCIILRGESVDNQAIIERIVHLYSMSHVDANAVCRRSLVRQSELLARFNAIRDDVDHDVEMALRFLMAENASPLSPETEGSDDDDPDRVL